MATRRRKSSKRGNPGCLLFMLGFLVLLVLFIVKYPDIVDTLEATRFLDLLKTRATTTTTIPTTTTSLAPIQAPPLTQKSTTGTTIAPSANATSQGEPSPDMPQAAIRQASLFFVRIGEDGSIQRKEVKRNIAATDSPLTDAIHALLLGPSESEIRTGLVSLIPRGTTLNSLVVKNSTAYIDLAEAFMYNRYGSEGFKAQLEQIVFTATAFSSVTDVQILIDGAKKQYLGGEGVFIGSPLSRANF